MRREFVLCLFLPLVAGTMRGDPVQSFKRMQFGDQRTMWSDLIAGQAPLFAVDRAVELHLPTQYISQESLSQSTAVKMQLSYDNEKFTSEWFTLSDGKGLLLDTLTVMFVYVGSDIMEVKHQQQFTKSSSNSPPPHQKTITIAYRWIQDVETDTRMGLNFLFLAGFSITLLALLAVVLDSGDLLTSRGLLVPEYEEDGGKRSRVKSFLLFQAEDDEQDGNDIGAEARSALDQDPEGGRLRARREGAEGRQEPNDTGAAAGVAGKGGEKGD